MAGEEPGGRRYRIVVGLDGSAGARTALGWAVREAARRSGTVLVVTAWPDPAREVARRRGTLPADRLALVAMQRARIAAATAVPRRPPQVLRMLVLADPVSALCHAAATADLVVVGAGPPGLQRRTGVAARLLARLARRAGRGQPAAPVLLVRAGRPTPHRRAPGGPGLAVAGRAVAGRAVAGRGPGRGGPVSGSAGNPVRGSAARPEHGDNIAG
ncbi:universal stress protein [Micromonospora sp. WMMD1102]|uniref:universal stress protein n=1 Tax=Micromonospora sp. WMMD1102 TaxID=3016105 RepID=UPI00241525BB|nr:universal stress protein [Micromonospora sp. WMMD1102]MDG4787259.1 universal stress protein [Micromonospora sp. WMMD1102]